MSVKVFRKWCSPKTVLVVMQPFDDPAQVLLSIRHAAQEGAKVLLAQLNCDAPLAGSLEDNLRPLPPWIAEVETSGAASGRTVMWAEIVSRAFVLNNVSIPDIPSLVRALNVDRVIISASRTPVQKRQPGLERLIPALVDVPVWVLGRGMALNLGEPTPARRILLPVTYGPDLEFVFRFAWQLAKAQVASLSVLHVFSTSGKSTSPGEKSPLTVKSWLPWLAVNLSPADCRIELAIRQGDPATEIEEFNARKPHDLIVFRSSADGGSNPVLQPTLVDQVCSRVPCPVAVLGGGIDPSQYSSGLRKHAAGKPPVVVRPARIVAVGA